MALGIVSFVLIPILGLLPVGLSSLRESANQMLEEQILKSVSAQCAVGSFDTIAFTGWYDSDGQPLESDDGAQFRVDVSASPSAPSYPGSDNAFDLSTSMKAVEVKITDLRTDSVRSSYLLTANTGK